MRSLHEFGSAYERALFESYGNVVSSEITGVSDTVRTHLHRKDGSTNSENVRDLNSGAEQVSLRWAALWAQESRTHLDEECEPSHAQVQRHSATAAETLRFSVICFLCGITRSLRHVLNVLGLILVVLECSHLRKRLWKKRGLRSEMR